jgi:hypothetical protein
LLDWPQLDSMALMASAYVDMICFPRLLTTNTVVFRSGSLGVTLTFSNKMDPIAVIHTENVKSCRTGPLFKSHRFPPRLRSLPALERPEFACQERTA